MSGKLWTEEQFNCPVCLDLPSDPVTIPCGHSYCMSCIRNYWSKASATGSYSCPECRQSFCPQPPLARNTMLAEAVEQLRRGAKHSDVRESIRSARRAATGAGKLPGWAVPCDLCHGEPRAAAKSCLVCMSSLCDTHLQPHLSKAALKQHELIPPTAQLAEKICAQHKYLQEFYCRQCQAFVCWLCTSNQHKGHDSVSTTAQRTEQQKVLSSAQAENNQKLKQRQQELKAMRKMMDLMKRSADRVHEEVGVVVEELQRSVERLQEILEDTLEEASLEKMAQAQEVTDSLQAEVKELKRRDTEMKELARCEDNIRYLQRVADLCAPLNSQSLPSVRANLDASFEPVREAVLGLRERVEDLCNLELGKITKRVNDTTLFTLGDEANRNEGPKGSFLKLFSGLGSRNITSRSQGTMAAAGVRDQERRGLGLVPRTQDVRSRDGRRARGHSSPSRHGPRREERDTGMHPSPTPGHREHGSLWDASHNVPAPAAASGTSPGPALDPSPVTMVTPDQSSVPMVTPDRSSVPVGTPGRSSVPVVTPAQAPAPSTGGFSRMASITSLGSLFRSHRRTARSGTAGSTAAPPAGGRERGMSTLPETPVTVNPSLFLDSPTSELTLGQTPLFPALREINMDSIQAPEPRTREEFLKYAVPLSLDPNTSHRRLLLSEQDTKAMLGPSAQPCPELPQRFDGWTQVLCRSPLSAPRCYWEVEWRGRGSSLGVAYGALSRKGSDSRAGLGYNAQSWALELSDASCSALHDDQKTDIVLSYSPRLGVLLDQSAGTLAFYSVAGSMTHLHTFRANFTQPLYAAFGVGSGVGVGLDFALGQFSTSADSIKICSL